MTAPTIPAYRFGRLYDSLDQGTLTHLQTGETMAQVGLVNAGLIRRDMRRAGAAFESLQARTTNEMLEVCARAANHFLTGRLPVSSEVSHGPDEYVSVLAGTCGLPYRLVRANMEKIAGVLREMPDILCGLTRGLDHTVLDNGIGSQNGLLLSYRPSATHLAAILPSNSPGVNGLWLPAIALRIPVLIKPGRADPWTPWRIMQALIAAGCPADAFGFYPTDHEGAAAMSDACQRVILFGDSTTVEQYAGNPRVSVHGPGFSKILFGEDAVDDWGRHLDMMVDSVARNGGRSCVNASTIVVPARAQELATALAARLAQLTPRPLDAEDASLAAFPDPGVAEALERRLAAQLRTPGAHDITADCRDGERRVSVDGLSYLLPTVIQCEDVGHPLARTEMLFPFVSVVEMPQGDMLDWIGPSLVVSAVTADDAFRAALLSSRSIDRLNLGPVPTPQVGWDQPHEGNLFEFLYQRRAIHAVGKGGE